MVFGVMAVTIFLWVTTSFHKIPASIISLVPIILLYLFRLLKSNDLSSVDWGALLLFGSGLSLGTAIHGSGLDSLMANQLVNLLQGQTTFLSIFILIWVAIIVTAVTSNTATAAILIPILIPFSQVIGIDMKILLIFMAIAISIDLTVPIGTPPNTITYYSGYIKMKDMVKSGLIITILASLVLTSLFLFYT